MDWERKGKTLWHTKKQWCKMNEGSSKTIESKAAWRIDAHQHFWHYDPVRYDWISDEMASIRKNFLPGDLKPVLKASGFEGCVAVQSHQSEEETNFQLANASQNEFIKGVVGWVDLQAANVEERLEHYSQYEKLKGFRHVLQGEPQRDMMLSTRFVNGVAALNRFGFTYDILIFPDQLNFTKKFVAQFPEQKFVVDHLAKPYVKKKEIKEWNEDITQLAKHENVWCKLSGMVTEADWAAWKPQDFIPYIDAVVNAFGVDRLMFGSDWPVCLVAAEYPDVVKLIDDYFSSFSGEDKQKIFRQNASQFYNL